MQAYVVSRPGGPEVLELQTIPDPVAKKGQVLIDIYAFGLNRAEAITRMGGSFDAVKFPRVIGIECVGKVLECPGGELAVGQTVAAAMGGLGRNHDGSYAEKTVARVSNVFPVDTSLDWVRLGAIPETYFTARGCCYEVMNIAYQSKVVVRPGASALGLAIAQIVSHIGGESIAITRSEGKVQKLLDNGFTEVLVGAGDMAKEVRKIWPNGADGVVDAIVSEASVVDDRSMMKKHGSLCLVGSLAESYGTSPAADIKEVLDDENTSFYASDELHVVKDGNIFREIVQLVEAGHYKSYIDAVFEFSDLVEAHKQMDANAFSGKVVIRVKG
jgi:NADPH2:quinone reductase